MATVPDYCFVYGTLKRGQSNHHLIANVTREVIAATVAGRLYDLGPFPALGPGDDRVRGELVLIEPALLLPTLRLLDELEGFVPSDPRGSIYLREIAEATTDSGQTIAATLYRYNRDPAALRYLPGGEWTDPSAAEITTTNGELVDFGRHVRYFQR